MTKRIAAIAIVGLVLTGLSACSIGPRQETPAGTPEQDRARISEGRLGEESVPPAVAQLVRDAESATMAGEHDQAAVRLERAIRIAPRNAVLWQNLAVVRYRQERFTQAESLALKSNSLTADAQLKRRNWVLIAEARSAMGDEAGADEARARARGAGGRGAGQ